MPNRHILLKTLLEETKRNVNKCFDQGIETIEEAGKQLRDQRVVEAAQQARPGFQEADLQAIVAPFVDCDASLLAQKLRDIADEVDGKIANLNEDNR